TTTTRPPVGPPIPAQPATAAAPVEAAIHFTNSRLVTVMGSSSIAAARGRRRGRRTRLHAREVARDQLKLLVGIAPRLLTHDGCGTLVGLVVLHHLQHVVLVLPGDAGRDPVHAAPVGAVAGEAVGG